MRKFLATTTLIAIICLSACSSQPTKPEATPVLPTPNMTATPKPTPTSVPDAQHTSVPDASSTLTQKQAEPISTQEKPTGTTANVFYCYNRWFDPDGNYVNSGHAFYSICGNCGEMGDWVDNECNHCGAVYTDRVETELFRTYICDPNDQSIIYSESDEPFIVK
jgi:hypothetical protein